MEKVIMRSSYIILKEKKLVIDVFDGILTLENFKGHKINQAAEIDFSPNFSLISDFRTIEVRMTLEDVKEYAEFAAARGGIVGDRKAAVVVKNPNQFIYASTYDKETHNQKLGQTMLNFLSFKEALLWLESDVTEQEILSLIEKYRKKPLFEWTVKKGSTYY